MSDVAEDVKFSLKVMINKQKTQVLFAEAGSDFADVLLSFLTLPLGTIVRILEKHYGDEVPVIGSLTTLYNGLSNLDGAHFWTEGVKQMLLSTRNSFETECRKLKLNIDDTQPKKYFGCEDLYCRKSIGMYYGTARCICGRTLNREIRFQESHQDVDNRVFSITTASFIICDNLRMVPNVARSVLETLSNLGITDTLGAELRNVTFGFKEIMGLLKGSFLSETPLTDMIILEGRQINSGKPKSEPIFFSHPIAGEEGKIDSKKTTLKLMVQKSTFKLLFAQANQDFVDFLFPLLTIPLGGVECLLGSNTCVKNIDNLYRSLTANNCEKFLKTQDTKTKLLEPKIAHGYIYPNHILPLTEESAPLLSYFEGTPYATEFLYPYNKERSNAHVCSSQSPIGHGNYVKGPRMYMVTDDLTVTPLCMTSSLSVLNKLEIPLSDVKEVELHIGSEEALRILKASLTSTCALTKSLINPLSLKKGLKQEN